MGMEALRLLERPIEEEEQKLREVAFSSKKGEAGRFFFYFLVGEGWVEDESVLVSPWI